MLHNIVMLVIGFVIGWLLLAGYDYMVEAYEKKMGVK